MADVNGNIKNVKSLEFPYNFNTPPQPQDAEYFNRGFLGELSEYQVRLMTPREEILKLMKLVLREGFRIGKTIIICKNVWSNTLCIFLGGDYLNLALAAWRWLSDEQHVEWLQKSLASYILVEPPALIALKSG